ncbi:MAG TPA: hypothetical protein VJT32_10195 [bacterium]|nr:hypothetical protein [bacterium]
MRIVIRGGDVIDGTGSPRRRADVLIENGTVQAVGAHLGATADRIIDAAGQIVALGSSISTRIGISSAAPTPTRRPCCTRG